MESLKLYRYSSTRGVLLGDATSVEGSVLSKLSWCKKDVLCVTVKGADSGKTTKVSSWTFPLECTTIMECCFGIKLIDDSPYVFQPDVADGSPMPPWQPPPPASGSHLLEVAYPLKVYNSLTRSKTNFIPMSGRRVLWYMCGPTVYDSAHMGHARFVDFGVFSAHAQAPCSPASLSPASQKFHSHSFFLSHPRTYISFDILRRIMTGYFGYDVKLCMNITDVDDKIIMRANESGVSFEELSRRHETSFLEDMRLLGVAPPEVMTRVSEYVPEVVKFIEGIIANGYAYPSNGSVYFDTDMYRKSPKHHYGKLVPENVGNALATEEGEGALSVGAADKHSACDFALWKASKAGEPSWPSPWGPGRPGWHIECSAMCGDTLGEVEGCNGSIDIHSGGVDLRFPHHENEIAQSEACYDCPQWVNYFVHSGHLNIEGLKMSKSLKNFIKINDAIEEYGARGLRLLFLNQRYNSPMNYSADAMSEVAGLQKVFSDFFASVKALLRETKVATSIQKWTPKDKAFSAVLECTRVTVREALADDFNTPDAMQALRSLVTETNKYMKDGQPVSLLVDAAGKYITDMFRIFGLVDPLPTLGWGEGSGSEGFSREAVLGPVLDLLASYREHVNGVVKSSQLDPSSNPAVSPSPSIPPSVKATILGLGDTLRNALKSSVRVKLEDKPFKGAGVGEESQASKVPFGVPQSSSWKIYTEDEIRLEEESIARAKEEKEKQKALLAAKEAKKKINPVVMFQGNPLYSALDDMGIPTMDAKGVALSTEQRKALESQWRAQEKDYKKYMTKQEGGGGASTPSDK